MSTPARKVQHYDSYLSVATRATRLYRICGKVVKTSASDLQALMATPSLSSIRDWTVDELSCLVPRNDEGQPKSCSLCAQRLMRDFKKIREEKRTVLEESPNPTNIMQWNAVMAGPEDTPWDGGDLPSRMLASLPCAAAAAVLGVEALRCRQVFLPLKTNQELCCPRVTGQFKLTMEFTEQYPNEPPKVKFLSALFHPNGELL